MTTRFVRIAQVSMATMLVLLMAGCAATANDVATGGSDVGFWMGLWHGFITPITFLVSLFNESVGIYEVHNNGGWYDFGFVIGVSFVFGSVLGGSGAARSARSGRS